jgi:hypothetical protein
MSERTITEAMKIEIDGSVCYPALLMYADFPSGPVRVWTGYNQISWDSQIWDGLAGFLTVDFVSESIDSRASGASVTVSGLKSEFFSPIMLGNYQGNTAKMWFALLDESTMTPIDDPYLMFSGKMDSDEIEDDGSASTLKIHVENRLADLLRPRAYRYTHEDQQALYPGQNDMGLEFVSVLQDVQLKWGPI